MKNIVDHIHTVCDSEIHGIEFDNALFYIQQSLGVESGDVAGNYFANVEDQWASMSLENRRQHVIEYVFQEMQNAFSVPF